jgi:hypothetical protein
MPWYSTNTFGMKKINKIFVGSVPCVGATATILIERMVLEQI